MSRKTKGERLLAELNAIEAAELQLAKPKRGPRTKGGIPTDVARGLKGARRPMPPRPANSVTTTSSRDRAQEVLGWYFDRVDTVYRRGRLNEATAAMLRQELNERAAVLSDAE